MAKKSMIARQHKREKLNKKYADRRQTLKNIIKTSDDMEEIMEAQAKLSKLPANSSKVRLNTRCNQCGRPHAVYKRFELCRICFREQQMVGNIPGGRKSSW